ncbi:cupin domain-containing protein [Kineosporia sp. J2-2]|uniref:Cupin domain-containing protein n=1 Tax=Kineosporia corallincola TaxID=2835133 RepID=A0ABS5TJN2_9ACTN|nr:cupin domain-containing protein [Kineosporia corallincola]MBT0771319.1 cupin domain-containing protein [Kineosporia corallincola]
MPTLPDWAEGFRLQQHPEGGWFAETYRSSFELPPEQLPDGYTGPRALATSILFLLLPGEISAWHVVRSDELWIHQRGGPLALGLGGSGESGPGPVVESVLGTDPNQSPQLLVPAGTWQTARPAGDEPVLVACVVTPGFDYRDWRLA